MITISPLAITVEVPYQRPAFIGALRRVFHAYLAAVLEDGDVGGAEILLALVAAQDHDPRVLPGMIEWPAQKRLVVLLGM